MNTHSEGKICARTPQGPAGICSAISYPGAQAHEYRHRPLRSLAHVRFEGFRDRNQLLAS
jgi:hypothetical protein